MATDLDWDKYRSVDSVKVEPQNTMMQTAGGKPTEAERDGESWYGHGFVGHGKEGGGTFKKGDLLKP